MPIATFQITWLQMSDPEKPVIARATASQRRLRVLGVLILLFGISGAGFVYWHGNRSAEVMDDFSTVGFNKARTRQMAILFGKSGLMVQDLSDHLRDPGVQAGIILTVALVASAGCFYFAPFVGINDSQRWPVDG
ncbi:MAG TPA: hypothetical protein VK327_17850 [Candidatus Paceibacterota bacterium]|nr:hypothetical protein [Candidatus Paceibacterota bacterium]